MSSAPTVQVRLLGGFELQWSLEAAPDIPTKKAQGLLAYLALHQGEAQARGKLAGLFWGDSDEQRAQHNLRQALSYLRKALEPVGVSFIEADRTTVRLATDLVQVDVLEFRRLASGEAPEDLAAAVALYRGDLLDGLYVKAPEFEAWLESERRQLQEAFAHALMSLAEAKRVAGEHQEALRLGQRLLALDPLQERVHRLLMVLYGELGMRESALQQFERCCRLLAEELGIEPEPETLALNEALRGKGGAVSHETAIPALAMVAPAAASSVPVTGPRRRGWWVLAAGAFAVVVAALLWTKPWEPAFERALPERMAFPLPDRPSIAVLPFANLSDDPAQAYFASGITDDLITDLSQIPGLFVIARSSTFVYQGQDVPIRQVAEDLGVRYVLEGSVRRAGDEVRINAQLIDATSGGHIWAGRYDGTMTDVLAFQDQVTRQVASELEVTLTKAHAAHNDRQETDSPGAYDAVLRALEHARSYTKEDFAIAIPYLEKAIRLDPDYARAHTYLGGILWNIANEGWVRNFGLTYEEALEKARHHLRLGMKVPSSEGHIFQSRMHSNEGRYEEAIAEAKIVVALNPNGVAGFEALGRALNKAGHAAEAVEPLQKAVRLNPRGDEKGWLLYRLGESLYLSERYEEAAEAFETSVAKNNNEWTYLFLAASLAQLGIQEEAAAALASFDRIYADSGEDPFTVSRVEHWAFKEQTDRARVQEGLRKAGVPEGAKTEQDLDYAQDLTPLNVDGATTIDAEKAKALLERGIKLVDVRDRADWQDGHIPGTVHMSLFRDFTDAGLSAVVERDEAVVFFGSGTGANKMAAIATARAVSWGFEKVYYFCDGFPGWKAAGYPIQVPPS